MSLVILVLLAAAPRTGDCVACHRRETPGAVRQWEKSAHAREKIGCEDCHGKDHARIDSGAAPVDVTVCSACHKAEGRQHRTGRHGQALHTGKGCTRNDASADQTACAFCHEPGGQKPVSAVHCAAFLKQSVPMREAGCSRCHQVERSCAACHTNHATDRRIVRDPKVCARCHMGPDHPQWEAWETSQHGALNTSAGPETGPTCQRCHMPEGTHDVSGGIATSVAGTPLPADVAPGRREAMVKVCAACHAPAFVRAELLRADAIRDQSLALVQEGRAIIEDLYDRKLLDPMPADRPPHPLAGQGLEVGAQILYEDTSHAERIFFKMAKFDFAKTFKGAYHQSPDYTHWYGNAELKLDLIDLKSEARRLAERPRSAPRADTLEEQLRLLKARFDRGALSAEAYAKEKEKLLNALKRPAPPKSPERP